MKRFFALFIHHWFIYLATLLIGVFAINYSLDLINKPRNEETITIFIASSENGSSTLLRKKLNNEKPDYLREINIFTIKQDSNDFHRFFLIYGVDNSDIVILPKNKIEDEYVTSYYASFDTQYIEQYISVSEYYKSDVTNKTYGVKIHSIGEDNNLISYRNNDFDDDYYAFFIKKSKHIGELNNSKYTTAFTFINVIKNG